MYWYEWVNWMILVYFLLLNGTYIVMTILAFFNISQHIRLSQTIKIRNIFKTRFFKPISLLVPAFNEERTIINNLKSLLHLDYPEFEIVIINDGSQDNTLGVLKEAFQLVEVPQAFAVQLPSKPIKAIYVSLLEPRLTVIDKENGGKADALNAGINTAQYSLFCAVDSDSLLDNDGLLKAVWPFIENPAVVAVGGIVRIVNDCLVQEGQVTRAVIPRNIWAKFQVVEYLRAFLFGRMGWDTLNSVLVISGAFGVFSKKDVIAVGGYRQDTIGEDMELVVRMHRIFGRQKRDYKIAFVPDPVCWTEVPESLADFGRQRVRWQKGLADALWKNRTMFFNPRYGWIGMFAFPFFVCFELMGTIVEVTGFILLLWNWFTGLIDWPFAILFFIVAVILGIVLSLSSIVLEELFFHRYVGMRQVMVLFGYAVLENLGYRQLLNWWRLKGLWEYIRGENSWGKMSRKGIDEGLEEQLGGQVIAEDAQVQQLD